MKGLRNLILGVGLGLLAATSYAEPQVHCGDIFEDEFTKKGENHDLLLNLDPGTQLDLVFVPTGTTLKLHVKLLEPTGNITYISNRACCSDEAIPDRQTDFVPDARIQTEPISSRGTHRIRVYNWSAGIYSLYVNCVMRDGREIKAGSAVAEPGGAPAQGLAAIPTAAAEMGQGATAASPGLESLLSGGKAKDELKTALLNFAKKKAVDMLTDKLAGTKAGQLLGGGSSQGGNAAPPAAPPAGSQGVAQELLVAAVSPSQAQFTVPVAAPRYEEPAAVAPLQVVAPARQPAAAPPAQTVSLDLGSAVPEGVTLYADKDFVGMGESFIASDPNLRDNTIGNDSASSLQVSAGCSAILYSDINFEGKSIIVTQSVLNLRDTRVGNDSVSSIRVRCQGRDFF